MPAAHYNIYSLPNCRINFGVAPPLMAAGAALYAATPRAQSGAAGFTLQSLTRGSRRLVAGML